MPNTATSNVSLSIVIPAKNEDANIRRTVLAARQACERAALSVQVVVVDNASTDSTVTVAREVADLVVTVKSGSVGALRNEGVRHCSGRFLFFLDADIELTDQWSSHIHNVLEQMQIRDSVGGSFVKPPSANSNLFGRWFANLNDGNNNYLGSAHMLIKREHFEALGGFDEALLSGEDSDFCMRARELGLTILNEPALLAYHHGFPLTATAFFYREWWHGSGDRGWSKVRSTTLAFMSLHVLCLFGVMTGRVSVGLTCLGLIGALCFAAASVKFARHSLYTKLEAAIVFYLYFWGRSMSLVRPRSRSQFRKT